MLEPREKRVHDLLLGGDVEEHLTHLGSFVWPWNLCVLVVEHLVECSRKGGYSLWRRKKRALLIAFLCINSKSRVGFASWGKLAGN